MNQSTFFIHLFKPESFPPLETRLNNISFDADYVDSQILVGIQQALLHKFKYNYIPSGTDGTEYLPLHDSFVRLSATHAMQASTLVDSIVDANTNISDQIKELLLDENQIIDSFISYSGVDYANEFLRLAILEISELGHLG